MVIYNVNSCSKTISNHLKVFSKCDQIKSHLSYLRLNVNVWWQSLFNYQSLSIRVFKRISNKEINLL